MDIDIDIDHAAWRGLDLDALARRSITAALAHLNVPQDAVELGLLACDDARIATLNADFRGKPTPTNVLSWPATDLTPPALPTPDPDGTLALGDIAISFDTCAREAADADKPLVDHVTHLIVHGTLHLLGYDHEDDAEAVQMEAIEAEILGNLGLPDPYSDNSRDVGGDYLVKDE